MESKPQKIARGVYQVGSITAETANQVYVKDVVYLASNSKFKPLDEFTKKGFFGGSDYPQTWALFYSLWYVDSGKYRSGLLRFAERVPSGIQEIDDFEKCIGLKPSKIEKTFIDFCKALPCK